jgi:hypothetical protein
LPTDIIEKYELDVSNLNVDQTLFVRDMNLGDKYTVVTRGELAVAVIKASDDAPQASDKAPEVIKKGKEEKK